MSATFAVLMKPINIIQSVASKQIPNECSNYNPAISVQNRLWRKASNKSNKHTNSTNTHKTIDIIRSTLIIFHWKLLPFFWILMNFHPILQSTFLLSWEKDKKNTRIKWIYLTFFLLLFLIRRRKSIHAHIREFIYLWEKIEWFLCIEL